MGTFYEDTDLGVQYLRQGVDAGSAQAHFELGKLLYCGQDVEEDEKEAFELFQMAAERGHVGAQFMAADMLLHSGMANGPTTWRARWTCSTAPLRKVTGSLDRICECCLSNTNERTKTTQRRELHCGDVYRCCIFLEYELTYCIICYI